MRSGILIFILIFCHQPADSTVSAECEQFDYCKNHGYCMNAGAACMCNPQFNGSNCSVCATGYFNYPWCYACRSFCLNGGICRNDTCTCPTNTTDIFCSNCAPNFNSQYCTQDPIELFIITNEVLYDMGGAYITVMGGHFNRNLSTAGNVRCRFVSYAPY